MNLFELDKFGFWYMFCMLSILGACFGSFLNVVILRAFTGESIVLPPSKCPKCHNKLKWYHNIPILSYLFLRGKCGFCKEPISIQYPLVEAAFMLLFLGIFLKFGLNWNSIFLAIVAALCLVLAVTDIKEQVIFDTHAYILAGVGLVYNFFDIAKSGFGAYNFTLFAHSFSVNKSFVYAILGLVAGALAMELLALVGRVLVGKRAFGEGDSFILGALGAVFGFKSVLPILLIGCVVQVVIIFPMFVKKLFETKEYKLLGGLASFILSVVSFKILETAKLLDNLWIFAIAFLIMGVCALYTCKKLIESTKKGESLTYVPFGPPLVIAALALMFIG